MINLRPMLAGKAPEDLSQLVYPLFASPKLDGVRCLIVNGQALSRTLKPIPNHYVQHLFGHAHLNGLDGELIVGDPTSPNCMQTTMSGVMSRDGEPQVRFKVFDRWDRKIVPFSATVDMLQESKLGPDIDVLEQPICRTPHEIEVIEQDYLSSGFEGVILRHYYGPYKFNRSTTREQYMLKLKRYSQDEALVIGTVELEYNLNEAELDERGYTKRSTHQANKVGSGMLGALVCHTLGPEPVYFNIGTGFDEITRRQLWKIRDTLPGRTVSYKHFAQTGIVSAPRHPVFVSFRDPVDLS